MNASTFPVRAGTQKFRNSNHSTLEFFWKVGKMMEEYQSDKRILALKNENWVQKLSSVLSLRFGPEFSRDGLLAMRKFYRCFKPCSFEEKQNGIFTGSGLPASPTPVKISIDVSLTWAHYYEMLQCESLMEICFYKHFALKEKWSAEELEKQIDSALYERIGNCNSAGSAEKLAGKNLVLEDGTRYRSKHFPLELLKVHFGHFG